MKAVVGLFMNYRCHFTGLIGRRVALSWSGDAEEFVASVSDQGRLTGPSSPVAGQRLRGRAPAADGPPLGPVHPLLDPRYKMHLI